MKFFLTSVLTLFSCVLLGQWNQSTISASDLYSIQNNGNSIVVGGPPVYFSFDNGTTWNSKLLRYAGTTVTGQVKGLHFFNNTEGLVTGSFFLANDEMIFSTDDGGNNWGLPYTNDIGSWPRDIEEIQFINSTVGYTAGTNGKVLKTIDGGDTWGLIAQIGFEELTDIWFQDQNTGFVVGVNGIWKTIDGGTTWVQVYNAPSSYLSAIHFPNTSDGFAVGETNQILKTNDGGDSWEDISYTLNENDDLNDVEFLNATVGYIVGDAGIYKTTSGGAYWGFYPTSEQVHGIDMTTQSEGYACGTNGSVFKTTNGGGNYLPIAVFQVEGPLCEDSVIHFNNFSNPGLTFQWYVDGILVSSSYNYAVSFPQGGLSHSVELVVSDGVNSNSRIYNFTMKETLDLNLSAVVVDDSLCYNQDAEIELYNTHNGALYWIEDALGNQISNSVTGNYGGDFLLTTSSIGSTQTFQLIGEKEVIGCGTNYDTLYLDVYNMTPAPIIHTAVQDPICKNDSAEIELSNSMDGVQYYLMVNGEPRSDTLVGTGGSISIFTDALGDTVNVYIGSEGVTGCPFNNASFDVNVHVPLVYFNQDYQMQEIGADVNFYNSSQQTVFNYEWSFENATPSSFSGIEPGPVSFNTLGYQEVLLVGTSNIGCVDSISKLIKVIPTRDQDSCSFVVIADSAINQIDGIMDLKTYEDGGFVAFTETVDESYFLNISNGMQDTIGYYADFDQTFKRYHLTRFSADGLTKWDVLVEAYADGVEPHTSADVEVASIYVDDQNNTYLACHMYDHLGDSLRITSSDGSIQYANGTNSGSSQFAVLLMKYDPNGKELWTSTFTAHYTTFRLGIAEDSEGNIYVSGNYSLTKLDTLGNVIWTGISPVGYCDDMSIYNDTIYTLYSNDMKYQKYDLNGNHLSTSDGIEGTGIAGVDRLIFDENGNMYMTGTFQNEIKFANQTFNDPPTVSYYHNDVYIAKFNRNGEEDWIRTFNSFKKSYIKGFEYLDGQLYLLVEKQDTIVETVGLPPITNTQYGSYVFTCDTAGQFGKISEVYDNPTPWGSAIRIYDILNVSSDKFVFAFPYKRDFAVGSNIALHNSTYRTNNSIIMNVDPSCMDLAPNDSLSSAYFWADVLCYGDTLFLEGDGSRSPTSYLWSSNGGNINDVNSQNTYMTFDTVGTYEVSLTVSNIYGVGGTMTRHVFVSPSPNYNVVVDDTLCFDEEYGAIDIPDATYVVWNSVDTTYNGSGYFMMNESPTGDSTFYFSYFNEYGCSKDSSIHFTVLPEPQVNLVHNPGSAWCSGEMMDLTLVGVNGTDTFYWDDYGPGPDLYELATNYNDDLYISIANGDCWNYLVVYSRHERNPSVSPGYVDDFCLGDSIVLTINGNAASYEWSNGDLGDTTTFMSTVDGIVNVVGYSSNGHCSTAVDVDYFVHEPPIVDYVFPPDTVCGSGTQTLETSSVSNISSYWEINRILNGAPTTQTINNTEQISFWSVSDYTVDVSTHAPWPSPCVIDTSISVMLLPSPTNASPGFSWCTTDTSYFVMGDNANSTAFWSLDGNYLTDEDSVYLEDSGEYMLQMDSLGCTTSWSYNVTLHSPVEANVIAPDGLAFCSGTFSYIELQSDTASGNRWYYNGNQISTNQSITVNSSNTGDYILEVYNPWCPNDQDTVTLITSNSGTINISTPLSNGACLGDSVLLITNSTDAEWFSQGVFVSSNDSLYTDQSGWFLSMVDQNDCLEPDSVYVTISTPINASISYSGNDTICPNDNVFLASSESIGNVWLLNSAVIGTGSSQNVTQEGTYGLLINNNGCLGDTDWVSIYHFPDNVPVVLMNSGDLETTTYQSYQWYLNGSTIPSASAQTLTPIQDGNYTVGIIDDNGCGFVSDPFLVNWMFVDVEDFELMYYPNPTSGIVNFNFSELVTGKISVFDALGKHVNSQVITNEIEQIDLQEEERGIYYVVIDLGNMQKTLKVVLQ